MLGELSGNPLKCGIVGLRILCWAAMMDCESGIKPSLKLVPAVAGVISQGVTPLFHIKALRAYP